jgi:hypothetical protein
MTAMGDVHHPNVDEQVAHYAATDGREGGTLGTARRCIDSLPEKCGARGRRAGGELRTMQGRTSPSSAPTQAIARFL